MAIRTKCLHPRPEVFIRRMKNGVIAVANNTPRKACTVKGSFMWAFFVELRLENMAVRADVLDRVHSRRRCSVVAVARRAGWRIEVAANHQGFLVNAGGVLGELIRCDGVSLHVRGVGMASRTGFGDIQRIHIRSGVGSRPQVVNSVTISAYRDLAIPFCEQLSMNTGLVLTKLIRAERGIVISHVRSIRVAAAAQGGNLTPHDCAAKPGRPAHRVHIRPRGISAMATDAGQTLLRMNVVRKLLVSHLKRRVEGRVAPDARVRSLAASRSGQTRSHQQDPGTRKK